MEKFRYTDVAKATLTRIADGYEGPGPTPERMAQICDIAERLALRESSSTHQVTVYQHHIAGAVLAAGPERIGEAVSG